MVGLPKAILFDLDDTLLTFGDRETQLVGVAEEMADSLEGHAPAEIGRLLEPAYQRFWADETLYDVYRFRLLDARILIVTETFATLGLSAEVAKRFAERFHERRDEQIEFFPGAVETIDELRRLGVKLALVTNGSYAPQRAKVDRFDLARRFDHVQIEEEFGFGKPEERAYIHAMAALGVSAADTWMVGDHLEWEVAAPQRLGIYSIWHDHNGRGLPANSPVRPDRIVRRISELLTVVRPPENC